MASRVNQVVYPRTEAGRDLLRWHERGHVEPLWEGFSMTSDEMRRRILAIEGEMDSVTTICLYHGDCQCSESPCRCPCHTAGVF